MVVVVVVVVVVCRLRLESLAFRSSSISERF